MPMNQINGNSRGGSNKKKVIATAGLAAALGIAMWFLAPLLLPVNVPPDFPPLPDLQSSNPSMREIIQRSDQQARSKPVSAESVGKLGLVYHANLFYGQAAAAYRIAARSEPLSPQWAYAQAVLSEETGAEAALMKFLSQTIELDPNHVPALIKLADSAFKSDRLDEAGRLYKTAADAPGSTAAVQAAFGRGRVAARSKDWNTLATAVAPVAAAYPHAAPLHELLQQAYTALGQTDKAEQARQSAAYAKWKSLPPLEDPFTDQLIEVCYSSTRLLKQAGLLGKTGRPDQAIDLARRAAQAEPADADVRDYLARTLITFYGDKPEAIDEAMSHLAECMRLRPSDPIPLGGFADDFFKSPKPPAAVQRLRALLQSNPKIPGIHFFLGQAAEQLGEMETAAAEYRAALKENPKDSGAHNKLGLIAEAAGRFDEASAYFRKAIQLNPMNTAARLNLAIDLMQRGNYAQGFGELNELLRIDPQDAAAHFLMGFAYLSRKQAPEAESKFRQGLVYKPGDAEARFGLGAALAAQGRRDDAAAELRQALQLRPNHAQAQNLLRQLGY